MFREIIASSGASPSPPNIPRRRSSATGARRVLKIVCFRHSLNDLVTRFSSSSQLFGTSSEGDGGMRRLFVALFALVCLESIAQAEIASYYGQAFAGRRTASGERFNPSAMTAAHRTMAFGTRVRVTNSSNGRSVVVRINDRGPHVKGRAIDLSSGAARAIGMGGTAHVRIEVVRH
jgi:3D (Asp-Asp-Asp) domain-containing protein